MRISYDDMSNYLLVIKKKKGCANSKTGKEGCLLTVIYNDRSLTHWSHGDIKSISK